MLVISQPSYIRCSNGLKFENKSKIKNKVVEVFFAETKTLHSWYPVCNNYISKEEYLRASRFTFEKDRVTYTLCHSVLRLILSSYMNVHPLDIIFSTGINKKPGLIDNPLFFNLSHTREQFAIAISDSFYTGIDLENINQKTEIKSIAKSYFSTKEYEFIFSSEAGAYDRFFLLWTRKEALLKALGSGIIENLQGVEVCDKDNILDTGLLVEEKSDQNFYLLYLYSKKIKNIYLSLAIPEKACINFHNLSSDFFLSHLPQ